MGEPNRSGGAAAQAMLEFPPRKDYVAVATEFVRSFCSQHTGDEEVIARVQLAAHELAENVVKYAAGGFCVLQVRVMHQADSPSTLWITTENDVAAGPLSRVQGYLQQLEQAPNPDVFYDQQIAETVKRTEGSGLGLARIRSEALMEISHEAHDGRLFVSAKARLGQPSSSLETP